MPIISTMKGYTGRLKGISSPNLSFHLEVYFNGLPVTFDTTAWVVKLSR